MVDATKFMHPYTMEGKVLPCDAIRFRKEIRKFKIVVLSFVAVRYYLRFEGIAFPRPSSTVKIMASNMAASDLR